jgi:hypothetical protein
VPARLCSVLMFGVSGVLMSAELMSEDLFRMGSVWLMEPGRKAMCYLALCSGPLPSSPTAATGKAVLL